MGDRPGDAEATDPRTPIKASANSDSLVGAILGQQYQILQLIGEGGTGVVYRARQLTVDRDVAIKILRKQFANDELAVARFENEATAIGRLRHPNTLRLYDCQRTPQGDLYLVTELLSGAPLSELLCREGRLPIARALHTLDEVCRSLAEAHGAGIVHRDLKPANIFLDRIGSEDVIKVLDFGIAKILQSGGSLTRVGAIPGTPHYMSPEHAGAQRIDHRTDIYALGVILHQMIVGRPPFDAPGLMDILKLHITTPAPRISEVASELGVPVEVEDLTAWMLEKSPEDRPQSVEEIRRHLPALIARVSPVGPLPARGSSRISSERPSPSPEPSGPATVSDGRALKPRPRQPGMVARVPVPMRSGDRGRPAYGLAIFVGACGVIVGLAFGQGLPRSEALQSTDDAQRLAAIGSAPGGSATTAGVRSRGEPDPDLAGAVPVARSRTATLTSDPPGAKVQASSGQLLGVTPLEVKIDGPQTFVLIGASGRRENVRLDPARDAGRTLNFNLSDPNPPRKHKPAVPRHATERKPARGKEKPRH